MPSMTTYLSRSSFLLPLRFIRRHFSQNFNWLTVNFPICSALTLAPGMSSGESSTCSCPSCSLAMLFEFTARAIKPRLHGASSFFLESVYYMFLNEHFKISFFPMSVKPASQKATKTALAVCSMLTFLKRRFVCHMRPLSSAEAQRGFFFRVGWIRWVM